MDIIKLRDTMLREAKIKDKKADLIKQFHDKDFELANILESQKNEIHNTKLSISEVLVAQFIEFFKQNDFEVKHSNNTYHMYPVVNSRSFIEFIIFDNFRYELRLNHTIYSLELKHSLNTLNNQYLIHLEPLNMDVEFEDLVRNSSTIRTMRDCISKIDLYIKDVKYNHEILKTTPYIISSFKNEHNYTEYETFVHMFKSPNESIYTFSPIAARLGISKIKTELDLLSLMCLKGNAL